MAEGFELVGHDGGVGEEPTHKSATRMIMQAADRASAVRLPPVGGGTGGTGGARGGGKGWTKHDSTYHNELRSEWPFVESVARLDSMSTALSSSGKLALPDLLPGPKTPVIFGLDL